MKRFALSVLALTLAACAGSGEPNLLNAGNTSGDGPDEFAIVTAKPLQMPDDLASLPAPTPGGGNLSDPTPQADAVAALGGRPGATVSASGDGALVSYVGRFGVTPSIRATLAAEDLAFRRANSARVLERLFNTNVYFRAYESQTLDSYRELERIRRAGIRTPSAPPSVFADQ